MEVRTPLGESQAANKQPEDTTMDLRKELSEMEDKLNQAGLLGQQLLDENRQLKSENKSLSTEFDALKQRYNEMEARLRDGTKLPSAGRMVLDDSDSEEDEETDEVTPQGEATARAQEVWVAQMEGKVELLETQNMELKQSLQDAQGMVKELTQARSTLEAEKMSLEAKVSELHKTVEDKKVTGGEISALQVRVNELSKELEEKDDRVMKMEQDFKSRNLQTEDTSLQIEALQQSLTQTERERDDLQKTVSEYEAETQAMADTISQMQGSLVQLDAVGNEGNAPQGDGDDNNDDGSLFASLDKERKTLSNSNRELLTMNEKLRDALKKARSMSAQMNALLAASQSSSHGTAARLIDELREEAAQQDTEIKELRRQLHSLEASVLEDDKYQITSHLSTRLTQYREDMAAIALGLEMERSRTLSSRREIVSKDAEIFKLKSELFRNQCAHDGKTMN
eukprot:Clim_evm7s214 gene=Clim_evmTU7s214